MRSKILYIFVGVVIIAVDFALIMGARKLTIARGAHDEGLLLFSAYVFVPSLSLLALAFIYSGIGLLKFRKSSAFSTGYILFGGLASFAICLDLAAHSFILDSIVSMADSIQDLFFHEDIDKLNGNLYLFNNVFIDMLVVFTFMLLQIGCGLIGGVLASRYGLMVILSGRTIPHSPKRGHS